MLPACSTGCPLVRAPAQSRSTLLSTRHSTRQQQHRLASLSHAHQDESSSQPQCSYTTSVQPAQPFRPSLPALVAARAASAAGRIQSSLQHLRERLSTQETAGNSSRGYSTELLAAMTFAAVPGCGIADLLCNRVFMAGFTAWFLAQFAKIFTRRIKTGVWDVRAIVDSGGMPSSHSALCSGVTTAIAMQHGFGSSLFAVSFCFSVIVMYDAAGVRRHAGKHAEVLNYVIDELLDDDHPASEVKLKEVLGHTPLQVCCGALLGIIMGVMYPNAASPLVTM